ncbi:MAG: hypothetical protein QG563_448, partial [Patescibacteria group bacterium]|nr:hypothetical protein [Patescibacteria group bacterium]
MILSRIDIEKGLDTHDIVIKPFIEEFLGPSSYDLHLARTLRLFSTI